MWSSKLELGVLSNLKLGEKLELARKNFPETRKYSELETPKLGKILSSKPHFGNPVLLNKDVTSTINKKNSLQNPKNELQCSESRRKGVLKYPQTRFIDITAFLTPQN